MIVTGDCMLGERIRQLRIQAGESQWRMGEQLGVAQRTIAGWETGNRQPNAEMIVRIAETYGVSTDYLLGRTDDPRFSADEAPLTELPNGLGSDELVSLIRRIVDQALAQSRSDEV